MKARGSTQSPLGGKIVVMDRLVPKIGFSGTGFSSIFFRNTLRNHQIWQKNEEKPLIFNSGFGYPIHHYKIGQQTLSFLLYLFILLSKVIPVNASSRTVPFNFVLEKIFRENNLFF